MKDETEATDEVISAAMWAYVAERYTQLMAMCMKAARYDQQYAEELFSDEVLRMLPGLIERWDGVRSFHMYASSYFSLHLRKIAARKIKSYGTHASLETLESVDGWEPVDVESAEISRGERTTEFEVADTVRELLSRLTPEEQLVIRLTKMKDWTYRQVAERLGRSHGYVAKVVASAMEKMRA